MKNQYVMLSILAIFVIGLGFCVFLFPKPHNEKEGVAVAVATESTNITPYITPPVVSSTTTVPTPSATPTPVPTPEPIAFEDMTDEELAEYCGLTIDEFIFMSRVIEAESDRSDNLEGRILIAETIFNRVNSSEFPDTIEGVLYQSGQFEVVSSGAIYSVGRTTLSDVSIAYAYDRIQSGAAPNVMYFNCSGYQYNVGTPYIYEGGNYFSTTGG